jgi:hypothetical protein
MRNITNGMPLVGLARNSTLKWHEQWVLPYQREEPKEFTLSSAYNLR